MMCGAVFVSFMYRFYTARVASMYGVHLPTKRAKHVYVLGRWIILVQIILLSKTSFF